MKVDNISHRTDENRLREAFKKFGDVGDVFIPRYELKECMLIALTALLLRNRVRGTMESRGFGFVSKIVA